MINANSGEMFDLVAALVSKCAEVYPKVVNNPKYKDIKDVVSDTLVKHISALNASDNSTEWQEMVKRGIKKEDVPSAAFVLSIAIGLSFDTKNDTKVSYDPKQFVINLINQVKAL